MISAEDYYAKTVCVTSNVNIPILSAGSRRSKRYCCKRCGKKFGTPLDSVVERNRRVSRIDIQGSRGRFDEEGIPSAAEAAGGSRTFVGLALSHRTIKNWRGIGDIKRFENQMPNYSGYYCYDEQYSTIDAESAYRLASSTRLECSRY